MQTAVWCCKHYMLLCWSFLQLCVIMPKPQNLNWLKCHFKSLVSAISPVCLLHWNNVKSEKKSEIPLLNVCTKFKTMLLTNIIWAEADEAAQFNIWGFGRMDSQVRGRNGLARSCSVLTHPCEICQEISAWLSSIWAKYKLNWLSADGLFAEKTADLQHNMAKERQAVDIVL